MARSNKHQMTGSGGELQQAKVCCDFFDRESGSFEGSAIVSGSRSGIEFPGVFHLVFFGNHEFFFLSPWCQSLGREKINTRQP